MNEISRIAVVGSGNVATCLIRGLAERNFQVSQLISRNQISGKLLAERFSIPWSSDLRDLDPTMDAVFLCVQDDQLPMLAKSVPIGNYLVLHTSGSTDLNVLAGIHSHCGVFYPMQTFSAHIQIDWSEVPIYLECNHPEDETSLSRFSHLLSPKVFFQNSEERMRLHISAVFACNFTNLMLACAADLMQSNHLDFSDLKHLVKLTVNKAFDAVHPDDVQTGPAVRNDLQILEKHRKSLSLSPELQGIYAFLSEAIRNRAMKNK